MRCMPTGQWNVLSFRVPARAERDARARCKARTARIRRVELLVLHALKAYVRLRRAERSGVGVSVLFRLGEAWTVVEMLVVDDTRVSDTAAG